MFKSIVAIGISVIFVILICAFPAISAAEIKVYDNNNQYLGILLNMEYQDSLTVFIPSINASYNITKQKLENPNTCGAFLYFESDDCSGIPYVFGPFPVVIDLNCPPYNGYFLPDLNTGKQFVPKSFPYGGMCGPPPATYSYELYYEIKEIQLPFTTPIALPVRFENVANTSDFYVIPVKKK